MANASRYDIEMKTESSDAVPEILRGTRYWHDTGTTENGEKVLYDSTGEYAYWYDGDIWLVTLVADVGKSRTDILKGFASVPATIEVVGGGRPELNATYNFYGFSWQGKASYESPIGRMGDMPLSPAGIWMQDEPEGSYYNEGWSEVVPPKTGWEVADLGVAPAPTLEYATATEIRVGFGFFSGSLTVSENVIADAWYRAETTAFESLASFLGCTEGVNCFRGFLPVQGDAEDYLDANVWQMTSGSDGGFEIEDTFGSDALWCSLQAGARIESVWESRADAMKFAGAVMAWLKQTGNLNEVENVTWCTLSAVPDEPKITRTQGINRERFWEQTIDLTLTYRTENVYA